MVTYSMLNYQATLINLHYGKDIDFRLDHLEIFLCTQKMFIEFVSVAYIYGPLSFK